MQFVANLAAETGGNRDGSENSAGATLDAWFRFSDAPITEPLSLPDATVPEPATMTLLLLGLGPAAVARVRRRRRADRVH